MSRGLVRTIVISLLRAAPLLAAGCGVDVEPLMPTPVLYTDAGVDPFKHLAPSERHTAVDILYATNRGRDDDWRIIDYSNALSETLWLGAAAVRMGGPELTWKTLEEESKSKTRSEEVDIELSGIIERGSFPVASPLGELSLESREFVDTVNERVNAVGSDDVFIYVHGAKVNFYNACAFTGQLAHFMGRDMVGIAFAWPCSQHIFSYVSGEDVRRAQVSGAALASLVEFLAKYTVAKKIHILCWSAGARVVGAALADLHERHPEESVEQRRARYRIGTVVFAAADLPLIEFVNELDEVNDLCDRTVISLTDDDEALHMATQLMGGGRRLGNYGDPLTEEQQARVESLERLEWVDVSCGKDERGFNIAGHRYWFCHPWCSADLLLALRTGLPAGERGLTPKGGAKHVWILPADYPQRLREAVNRYNIHDWVEDAEGVRHVPAAPLPGAAAAPASSQPHP